MDIETLQVSRSWYYEQQSRSEASEVARELRDAIACILLDCPGYSYRRVTHAPRRAGLRNGLRTLQVLYVMALNPSHAWWHPEGVAGSLQEVAHEAGWMSLEEPGQWVHITRTFRDGSTQDWWAVETVAGPYGPDKKERAIVATTDPQMLPDPTT